MTCNYFDDCQSDHVSTYYNVTVILVSMSRAGSGVVRMDPLRFLAGCHTRRLNQGYLSVIS